MMMLSRRQWFAVAATVLVGGYALAVLIYVRSNPDVGLHCTFKPIVNRANPDYLRDKPPPAAELVGATILQIGPNEVHTWPDWLRGLRELSRYADPANDEPLPAGVERHGDETWLRVRLRPADAGPPFEVWCLLGQTSPDLLVPSLLWVLLEVGLFGVGLLVYWKRPNDRSATSLFLLSIVLVGAYMGGYHWSQLVSQPVLLIGFAVFAMLLAPSLLHFYHLFPRPKRWLDRAPYGVLGAIYGPPLVFLAVILIGYTRVRGLADQQAPAVEVSAALDQLRLVIGCYLGWATVLYFGCLGCLTHSLLTARDDRERNQVRLILIGAATALVPIVYSLYLAVAQPTAFDAGAATWPMFTASACVMAAFAISIGRYRLLQLDQLVTSGMAYFLLSCLAALVYYGLVFIGMLVLGSRVISGPSVAQAMWVSGSALVVTVVLDTVRRRFRQALDRRYHRDKHHLDRTLERLGEAIGRLVEPPTLARQLLQASVDLFAAPTGAVYLRDGEDGVFHLVGHAGSLPPTTTVASDSSLAVALEAGRPIALYGPADVALPGAREQLRGLNGAVAVPLTQDGRLLGILLLGPKPTGLYSDDDLHLLAALAQLSTPALESAAGHQVIEQLQCELQEKVEKISEQQRRIGALQRQILVLQTASRPGDEPTDPSEETKPATENSGSRRLIGQSPAVARLTALARRVAARPAAVLLRGESGTGKELLAEEVHRFSARADKPLVRVHCAALAPGLLESELFGHVRGAFTGAVAAKPGRFELAHQGTLFLDEVGDLPLDTQVKLLRVLQEGTFERVGSNETVTVDVRIIAATHRDLEELMRRGLFREDLFYRLNVLPIHVPALRERPEDIPELALHFLREVAGPTVAAVAQIDDDAMTALKAYSWPGNIRELHNAIERAVVAADGPLIAFSDLPAEVRATSRPTVGAVVRSGSRRQERLRRERDQLMQALAAAGGNKAEAARRLGVARSTLVSRLKKHGLLVGRDE